MPQIQIEISEPLLEHVKEFAEKEKISVEEYLVYAVTEYVRVMLRIEKRYGPPTDSDRESFLAILAKAPNVPPMPGDELE